MFKVVLIPPDGHARAFGHPGSSPGSFGNVAGVVADDRGNVIVADKARGVVMAFDQRFELVGEFGSGDDGRRALTRPTDLVLGASGKLYVTQARERGVAVYKLEIGGATAGREQERPIRVEKIARARGTTITNGPREHDSGPADGPPGRDEGGDGGTNVAVSNNGSSLWEEP
jgi:sugar lactone lactonase YvrE